MPPSTNFLPFNPPAANQENDATYAGDALRTGGAPVNAIFPSNLANKAFYQWSIMIAALAGALVNKGYSPNDGSASPGTALASLEAVLANLMTQADMAPWALLASPTFTGTPAAPTPATADSTTKLATTAFVHAVFGGVNFSFGATSGYIQIPAFNGFMIQWTQGGTDPAVEGAFFKPFPFPFPTACMAVQVTMGNVPPVNNNDCWYQVVSYGVTGVTVYKQGTGGTEQASNAYIFAIGY